MDPSALGESSSEDAPIVSQASLIAQLVSAMQETRVQSLGWEDPLEKEMATHSSILAWRISWTVEPGRFPVHGVVRVRHDSMTKPPPPPQSLTDPCWICSSATHSSAQNLHSHVGCLPAGLLPS